MDLIGTFKGHLATEPSLLSTIPDTGDKPLSETSINQATADTIKRLQCIVDLRNGTPAIISLIGADIPTEINISNINTQDDLEKTIEGFNKSIENISKFLNTLRYRSVGNLLMPEKLKISPTKGGINQIQNFDPTQSGLRAGNPFEKQEGLPQAIIQSLGRLIDDINNTAELLGQQQLIISRAEA